MRTYCLIFNFGYYLIAASLFIGANDGPDDRLSTVIKLIGCLWWIWFCQMMIIHSC